MIQTSTRPSHHPRTAFALLLSSLAVLAALLLWRLDAPIRRQL